MRLKGIGWAAVFSAPFWGVVVVSLGCASSGSTVDWTKIPIPDVVTKPTPKPPAVVENRALAFEVLDGSTGAPISNAIVRVTNLKTGVVIPQQATNEDGYVAFILPIGMDYQVDLSVANYQGLPSKQAYTLVENSQVTLKLARIVVVPPVTELPYANLNIRVMTAAKIPIVGATCRFVTQSDKEQQSRTMDGSGFANVGVRGPADVSCSATHYKPVVRSLSPGDHTLTLEVDEANPPPAVAPAPGLETPDFACSSPNNTGEISQMCLQSVARLSTHWQSCSEGSQHACHLYVREVARALNSAQKATRWGLITKPSGSNVDGFGEDVIAWLPARWPLDAKTWEWNGIDIIGGAGAPGARWVGGKLHGAISCGTPEADAERWCNRSDNHWAPVPKQ